MLAQAPHMRDVASHDPYAAIICAIDGGLMSLYRQTRLNARRTAHLVMTLLPMIVLLVGSCKTAQMPWAYGGADAGPAQFRTALFPDRVNYNGAHYYPAAGYVSGARSFIEGAPSALMLLTREEVGYIYGKPALRRLDADAEVWQYKTRRCVVDFYFYGKTAGEELSHIDVRLKKEVAPGMKARVITFTPDEEAACLRGISRKSFTNVPV